MVRNIKTLLTSVCALLLCCAGCDEDCIGTTVTYEVDGASQHTSIYFHDEFGNLHHHSSIALPWIKKFNIEYRDEEYYGGGAPEGYYQAYISATVEKKPGRVAVKIYVDGKLKRQDSTRADNQTATARHAVYW